MKIFAIYSSSRVGFDDWFASVSRMIATLGIPVAKFNGAYWEQGITKALKKCLESDAEYILIMDGDSWFLPGHIKMLYNLLEKYSEYDCIFPVQVRRGSEDVLFLLTDDSGNNKETLTLKEIHERKEIRPAHIGHFGLTLFRKKVFDKIPKPWFWSQPDKNGDWSNEKIDADIWFWKQFDIGQCKAGLACNVFIGHLQLVCTFPDVVEHCYKPIHVMMNNIDAGKIPVHCYPVLEGEKSANNNKETVGSS